MVWYSTHVFFFLLTVHPNVIYSFNRGRVTEKPHHVPSEDSSSSPKQPDQKPHISEFTDPHTGFNPFLDLEEGPTSLGRNVMKDEKRDDVPYMDYDDIVEGESSPRRWDLDDDKKIPEKMPARWPIFDDGKIDNLPIPTTPSIFQKLPTTVDLFITPSTESVILQETDQNEKTWKKIKKENDTEPSVMLDVTVISALATTAVIIALVLLVGACWWRKKLKISRSSSTT